MGLLLKRTIFGDPVNVGNVLTRHEAHHLLNKWVKNERLKLHMLQVGHLMRQWAKEREHLGPEDQWQWEMAGMLHDADWDQWPEEHCNKIITELENRNIDPEIIHAIASHGPGHFGVEPVSKMDKMLYAFDELSGLIHAYALMRPGGYDGMEVQGVKKRLKEKSFAANVSRDDIYDAISRADLDLDDLIEFVIRHHSNLVI